MELILKARTGIALCFLKLSSVLDLEKAGSQNSTLVAKTIKSRLNVSSTQAVDASTLKHTSRIRAISLTLWAGSTQVNNFQTEKMQRNIWNYWRYLGLHFCNTAQRPKGMLEALLEILVRTKKDRGFPFVNVLGLRALSLTSSFVATLLSLWPWRP